VIHLNVSGLDDGFGVDDRLKEEARQILLRRIAPLRVSGLANLDMQWVHDKRGESRLVSVRYAAEKRQVKCKLALVPRAPFGPSYAADTCRLTIGLLALIVDRLGRRGVRIDLSRPATAIARDFEALARVASRP
jgi:hypothetical protein